MLRQASSANTSFHLGATPGGQRTMNPMKALLIILLVGAAGSLAWIGWQAPDPDHEAHQLEGAPGVHYVPAVLLGDVPQGARLLEFVVDGPCCDGCSQKLYGAALAAEGVSAAAIHYDGDQHLAFGQVWIDASENGDALLGALTFEKYTASRRAQD